MLMLVGKDGGYGKAGLRLFVSDSTMRCLRWQPGACWCSF